MTLENLLSIGRLKPHSPARAEIQRLLAAAEASLQDARREQISAASRFDMACKSLMQSALVALMANGYRPSTSEPGHHQTILQTLPKTVGLAAERVRLFDVFRRARNVADYEGEPVEHSKLIECIEAARQLLADVRAWLKANRPDLA
jgi:hypothetical protein